VAHGQRLVLVVAVLLSAAANTVLADDSLFSARSSAVEAESAPSIRVLTWNVLAPSVLETLADALRLQSGGKGRAQRLNDRMKPTGPDIIGLQEVTEDFLGVVLSDPRWSGFHATVRLGDDPPGGLVLLSRFPILQYGYFKLPSPSGRYALLGTLSVHGQVLQFANVHLESPLEAGDQRRQQIAKINRRLDSKRPALWVGDFNFGDEARVPLLSSYDDAFARLYPDNAGVTYDLEHNPLARGNAFRHEPSRRLDRILVSKTLQVVAAGLVGQPEEGRSAPSDHYGVWADVRFRTGEGPALSAD